MRFYSVCCTVIENDEVIIELLLPVIEDHVTEVYAVSEELLRGYVSVINVIVMV